MKHIKAQNVLPEEVVKIIQQYVDGEYLYIPRKDDNVKAWGEKNGTKVILSKRNAKILDEYVFGTTAIELSHEYYLSVQSIRRIICEQRKLYSR